MVVMGGASAAPAACSGGSDLLSTVVSIAPKCFDACPDMCKPLEKFLKDFTTSGKVAKDAICEEEIQLDCAFGDAFAECGKVLSMSSSTGLDLPTSVAQWTDFKQECGPSSSGKANVGKGFLSATAPATEVAEDSESRKVGEESPEQPGSKNVAEPQTGSANDSDVHSTPAKIDGHASSTEVGTTEAPPAACNHEDPTVSLVMSLAPTCFVKCPALCAAVEAQASHMGAGVPDAATVKEQVCASQDIFACAVQAAHLSDCQPVLSAGSSYGLPQSSADLSRLCGQGASDTKSVGNSAMRFASPALSAALLAWMLQ